MRFVDTSIDEIEGDVSVIVNRSRTITRKLKCTVGTEAITAIAGVCTVGLVYTVGLVRCIPWVWCIP